QGEGNNCCHRLSSTLDDKLVTLVVHLIKHLTEVYSGFAGIDCLGRRTRWGFHRIIMVIMIDMTIPIIAIQQISSSSRGVDIPGNGYERVLVGGERHIIRKRQRM